MSARLLFLADLHLGRRPRHVPDDLAEHGLGVGELTPLAAWRAAVAHALAASVDGVVLGGDVVEADNARFEAFGPLEDGVRALVDGGIPVWAVAGNHDVEALPRLADRIDGFRLLGRGGRWETVDVRADGRVAGRLSGWSFPAPHAPESPLGRDDAPRRTAGDGLPWVGVLHADLDVPASVYAPVTRAALLATGLDGWLLGHVHAPSLGRGRLTIGYAGSTVGLDPSETGPHGAWVVTLDRPVGVEAVPLAPLVWDEIEVPVDAATSVDDALQAMSAALRRRLEAGAADPAVRAVGFRVTTTGTTPAHRALARAIEAGELQRLRVRSADGRVVGFVHDVVDAARPPIDLAALARDPHAPGLVARQLLALERDDDEGRALVREARVRLAAVAERNEFRDTLPAPALDDARVRRLLLDAGTRALEELLRSDETGATRS